MEEYVINLGPILLWLAVFAIIILIGVIGFLIHSFKGLALFSKHDNSIIDKFLSKYPNVTAEFIKKDIKAQNIENNQEIHEINKCIDVLEQKVNTILEMLKQN